ncbi:hypothetical protein [Fuscibacter oryzae]|uniref:Uncharacterized protein n=1 Tax=Fuscibacter oryzae TaxID=2803939 RepID=A0A8J7SWZ0_9RHOB|nr:hypothetical protein [Fuscibacter oryzae]MBL4930181.1 hypothetical protein [Fuscibacter oryzae]
MAAPNLLNPHPLEFERFLYASVGEDRNLKRSAATVAGGRPGTSGAIWAVFAIIFVLFQMFMVGGSGSGE